MLEGEKLTTEKLESLERSGKRFLFQSADGTILEGAVGRIAHSGKYVNISGMWFRIGHIFLLEVLG